MYRTGTCLACLLYLVTGYADDPVEEPEKPGAPLTTTFALTSNYVWQGFSQTDNQPAAQAGMTYTLPSTGFYANVWASNVLFPDGYGNTAWLEMDTSVGATNSFGEFSYDIVMARYNYPQTEHTSYNELLVNVQFYAITALLAYSNSVYASGSKGVRYNLGLDYDIPPQYIFHLKDMNISGGIGHYSLPRDAGLQSFSDVKIGLTKTIRNYHISLAWTDTSGVDIEEWRTSGSTLSLTVLADIG